ncbi:MAG: type I methionyl aminopeptidase [Acidimicrobiia bacterium]|nr:type I methionyl aminopeptidase [Acidimicrobiia bacterium]
MKLPRLTIGTVRPGRISPMRPVPASIARPDYAETGVPRRGHEPNRKSPDVLERLRRTCHLAADVLAQVGAAVAPGVTTEELDELAHNLAVAAGAYPSPLNYNGFPKAICTSVNEVICHGIPDSRKLASGDIVNLDVTVYREGVHGDTNATFFVGPPSDDARRLVDVTRECLDRGIAAVRPGRPVSDIGRAIQDHAESHGYGVVRTFVGHGIGEQFHTDLQIPHYYTSQARTAMEEDMVFTIEPMITQGSWREVMWDDGWTAITEDRKLTAQFEHTIRVGASGAEILTLV